MFNKKTLLKTISLHVLKAVVAIGLASAAVLFFSWQFERINTTLAEKRKLAHVLEKRSETAALLKKNFASIGQPEQEIRAALLSADDVLPFVNTIEKTAQDVGLYHDIHFGGLLPSPAGSTRIAKAEFSVTARGEVKTIIRYLDAFEKLPYIAGINSLSISAGPEGWNQNAALTAAGSLYVTQPQ